MLYLSIGAIIEYLLILLIIMMKLDLSNPRIISFFSVISMFITTIFVLALKKYCEKKKFNLVLHNKKKLLTFFIMNAVVFMMQIITASFDIFEAQMQLALLIIISFVIIFQVGTFIMLSVINELDNYKNRHNMYEGNINSMSSQAEAIINANEELKKLRHDLKQHLTTLYGFINASSSYLQDLLNDSALLSLQQLSHTGCIPIDSIINENHRIALAQKINFTMSSNAMPDMSFEHMTLALILGNALENAIEATVKLPEDERYINVFIKFTMKYPKQMLRIKIENSCVDYTKKSRWEQFFTTKNDVENHGIGLSSIKAEVAKYNGSCDLSCENGVFTLDIELISERTIEGAII
jgi:hypothetical protein